MSFKLTIDQGNTAAKVVVWDGDNAVDGTMFTSLTDEAVRSLVERYRPAGVMYCSVVDDGAAVRRMFGSMGIECHVLTHLTPMPLDLSAYANTATLGADRIAAMVGAMSLYPGRELLVIDIGTAVTYDHVMADGRFVGGNIAPGVAMRLNALNHFTARLPLIDSTGDYSPCGTDTRTAMRGGAVYGVVGEIAYYRSLMPAGCVTVLAGGWAADIAAILGDDVKVERRLVGLGLNRLLNYSHSIK